MGARELMEWRALEKIRGEERKAAELRARAEANKPRQGAALR